MATSSAAIEILSKATGIKLVTLGHIARILREKGELWPRSVKGGGKNAVHVRAADIANLMLALAGTQPSDAPSIVAQLGAARLSAARRKNLYPLSARALVPSAASKPARDLDLDLRSMLELLIEAVASSKALATLGRRSKWTLWLNSSLGSAWVSWVDAGEEYLEQYVPPQPQPQLFADVEQQSLTMVERLMKIPFALVAVAADLHADSLERLERENLGCDQQPLNLSRLPRKEPQTHSRGQPLSRYTRGRPTPKR